MSAWLPTIVLGAVVYGIPLAGLILETYFAPELEWHE